MRRTFDAISFSVLGKWNIVGKLTFEMTGCRSYRFKIKYQPIKAYLSAKANIKFQCP